MVTSSTGSIVLIPFLFSDLSQSKLRPAVVLAPAARGDWVLCQITSKPYGDPRAEPLNNEDFASGSLRVASFVRPAKLFTAHEKLLVAEVGRLQAQAFRRVRNAVVAIF